MIRRTHSPRRTALGLALPFFLLGTGAAQPAPQIGDGPLMELAEVHEEKILHNAHPAWEAGGDPPAGASNAASAAQAARDSLEEAGAAPALAAPEEWELVSREAMAEELSGGQEEPAADDAGGIALEVAPYATPADGEAETPVPPEEAAAGGEPSSGTDAPLEEPHAEAALPALADGTEPEGGRAAPPAPAGTTIAGLEAPGNGPVPLSADAAGHEDAPGMEPGAEPAAELSQLDGEPPARTAAPRGGGQPGTGAADSGSAAQAAAADGGAADDAAAQDAAPADGGPARQAVPKEDAPAGETGAIAEESAPEEAPGVPAPSRSVTIMTGHALDIAYPGGGWVYLGAADAEPEDGSGAASAGIVRYAGRSGGQADGTTFTVIAQAAGSVILHFAKNDPLTQTVIDDYLGVTVAEERAAGEAHVAAPAYADLVPAARNGAAAHADYTGGTAAATAADASGPHDGTDGEAAAPSGTEQAAAEASSGSDDLLRQAQDAYDGKDYADCLGYLADFFNVADSRLDEGLFLQGQALEAPSSARNIKAALSAYRALVEQYPQSARWKQASDRIIYLQRFYFDIR